MVKESTRRNIFTDSILDIECFADPYFIFIFVQIIRRNKDNIEKTNKTLQY